MDKNTTPNSTLIRDWIKRNEEPVPYAYLDIKGNITAGAGFKVDTEDQFVALEWRTGPEPDAPLATEAQKREAYRTMRLAHADRKGDFSPAAVHYGGFTTLRLSNDYIDRKVDEEIAVRTADIRRDIGADAWNKLTERQRAALVDIHYANGSLDKFPNLKTAAVDGTPEEMAAESLFFADSEKGIRHDERLLRNYAALTGRDVEDPDLIAEYHAVRDRADAAWRKKRRETSDEERRAKGKVESREETADLTDHEGDDTLAGGEGDDDFASVKSFLQSPGDDEDEALLKDDLTEDEVRRVMLSNAYNDNLDPRFKALNNRIAWWFEDRWGDGDARVDATGRMIQAEHPETPAPARPLAASVASSGVDLGREIGRVVDAVFGKARPRYAPQPEPDEGRGALMLRQAQHEGKGLDSRLRGNDGDVSGESPVLSLQKALNRDDVRHGVAVLDDPLKLDGVAGPKTRRMLRQTVAGLGADGFISRL